MRSASILALMVTSLLYCDVPGAENWPQFRGGPAAGVAEGGGLPDSWSTTENVVWKTEVPGRGWSSPIVWGSRIFVTSVTREGKSDVVRKGLYFGGENSAPPTDPHRWIVYCLDFQTGKILWQRQAHEGRPSGPIHIKNSYASETPVTDGERVYVYFGNVGLFCYDQGGKELWSKKWGSFPTFRGWGTAASPVLHQGRLYVVNDNQEKSFLAAVDAKTGKERWRVDRDEKSNWATPFVWENDQRTEIVTAGRGKVRSYDLDGKPLWELGPMSTIAIPTPFTRHGLLYVSSGYVLDKARPLYAVRPGAKGDISPSEDGTTGEHLAWVQKTAGPYNPTPLVYDDYLYVLYDRGFLSCYDARTGQEIYSRKRLEGSSAFTASPWAYDGKVFCLSEDGDTHVVQAGPEFKLIGRNSLDELSLATPALVRDSLILRTETKLYRVARKPAAGAR